MPDVRQAMFPYGMAKNPDGSWTFFNRHYKPLGVISKEWCDWDDARHKMRLKGLGPATLARLDFTGAGTGERIYFYNDGCIPGSSPQNTRKYMERLQILLTLKTQSRR